MTHPPVPGSPMSDPPRADPTGVPAEASPGWTPDHPARGARRSAGRSGHRRTREQGSFWRELPVLLAIAVVLALVIKTFLVQAFFIPSGSMEQTLHIHDRVLVNKVSYHLHDPHRGEVVVFDTKGSGFEEDQTDLSTCPPANGIVDAVRSVQRFIGVGGCGDTDYIKRVIAGPGDTVECCNAAGQVVVNGHGLNETYNYLNSPISGRTFCASPAGSIKPSTNSCGAGAQPVKVPKGMYWVMGDHRSDSSDSRDNGFVPAGKIVGRAFIRVWPPSRIAFLRVPGTFQHAGAAALGVAGAPVLATPALMVPLIGLRLGRRRRRRQPVR